MKAEPETPDLKWITLDCSQMEPPEPMLRVLEQLDRLKQGEGIKMLHRMKPRLLFPKLQENELKIQPLHQNLLLGYLPCTQAFHSLLHLGKYAF